MCYTVSDTSWAFHVVSWAVLCYLQRQPAFLLFLSPGYGRMWAKGGETMEMKISCKCGSSFSVKGNCKNKSPFICQNCGKALPGEMSEHVLELLSVYKKLCDDIRSVELYEIEISDFKI